MSADGDLIDDVAEVLRQHPPDDPITSSELAEEIGIRDAEANPKTREIIRDVCEERRLPVAATSRGYFVLETSSQLEDYLERLDGRISGIQSRKQLVAKAWNRRQEGDS